MRTRVRQAACQGHTPCVLGIPLLLRLSACSRLCAAEWASKLQLGEPLIQYLFSAVSVFPRCTGTCCLQPCEAGLFETHDGGASFSPAPHASLQCDDSGGNGRSIRRQEGNEGHLPKFELIGAMMGLGIMQVGGSFACWCCSLKVCICVEASCQSR